MSEEKILHRLLFESLNFSFTRVLGRWLARWFHGSKAEVRCGLKMNENKIVVVLVFFGTDCNDYSFGTVVYTRQVSTVSVFLSVSVVNWEVQFPSQK